LAVVVATGCSRTARETWPDSDVLRYEGPTSTVDGERRANGEWRFWYPNGTQQAEGDYRDAPLPGDEHLGPDFTRVPTEGRARWWTFWDDDGRMLAEGQYEDGLRAKLWVCWYENGRQCCTGHFEADRAHGYHVTWYPGGEKRDERTYVEGRLDGARTLRSEDGRVVWSGEYRAGELLSSTPAEVTEPPVHDVGACAERAEAGVARSVNVASRDL
jgi:hypothetical protein